MPVTNFGNIADELREIQDQFTDLVGECKMLLRGTGMIGRRAEAYWIGHIAGALEGRGSMVTMEETIQELLDAANPTAEEDEGAMPLSSRANRSQRTAKMDLMTGFTGKKVPDPDLGLTGNGYFEKWTTVALPDTGKDSAIDDEQQPTGGGAPATVIPGAPLKAPMEAQDITRPKLRESPEASRRKAAVLRKIASEIRLLDHITARRLMAAADELSYDALSTATLPEAGDESNEVDDYQDNLGHGTLSFFGTDPAKSTSLTRESSRRTAAEEGEAHTPCEVAYRIPGSPWKRKTCKTKAQLNKLLESLEDQGAETRFRDLEPGDKGYAPPKSTMQYASRGASRRRFANESTDPKGLKGNIDMKTSLGLVEQALQGKYDRGAVAHILKADYDRIVGLLKSGQNGQSNMVPGQQGERATASRRHRRALAEGDAPLKPEPTVGDQDGPGADGAGGFYKDSKAPLQETMTAQDVERPKLRENPEAGRLASLWNAFKSELIRQASGTGKWNSGRYSIEARDYGDSVEVQASVVDRENLPMPVGSILFSRINDSPRGRYATVEVNDGILENRTTEFTLQRPRQAGMIVRRLVAGVVQTSKDLIDGITV